MQLCYIVICTFFQLTLLLLLILFYEMKPPHLIALWLCHDNIE